MNPTHVASEIADPPARKPRYAYASGSRPVAGYTIKRGVGRGGFGEVYFAVSDAGKEVALKLIRRNLEVELRGVTHCLNLKHPNLIDLYDIRIDDNDDRWVVMEYVSGASLEDVVSRYPNGMPVDMALHWFSGICAAVSYLHDHGIVHRDLKPGNIFLDNNRVKVGDYGLSKFISCSRRSGQTESVGTVHYMAPEIANGRYGKEIDTYALGIILYEMLTGKVPFEGESVGEVLMKHLTAEPDLSLLAEPFRTMVRQAMAKDPEQRIRNVDQFVAILEQRLPVPSPLNANYSFTAGMPTERPLSDPRSEPEMLPYAEPQTSSTDDAGPRAHWNPSGPWGGRPPDPPLEGAANVVLHPHGAPQYGHGAAWGAGSLSASSSWWDEPIAAAARRVVQALGSALQLHRWPPLVKALAGLWLVAVALGRLARWFPPVVAMSIVYLVYRTIWSLLRRASMGHGTSRRVPQPTAPLMHASAMAPSPLSPGYAPMSGSAPPSPPAPSASAAPSADAASPEKIRRPWRRRETSNWQQVVHKHLASRTWHRRASEITWALFVSALVSGVGAGLYCLIIQQEPRADLSVWMWLVTTLASWAIIVPAKLAEGRFEDQAPLRFIQFLSGAAIGCAAWGLAAFLFMGLPTHNDFLGPKDALFSGTWTMQEGLFGKAWTPRIEEGFPHNVRLPLPMYAVWFSFLFVLLGWSRQVELLRSARVSLWSIACSAFVGFLITFFWWFPQPLGLCVAAAMSLAIQLGSPWMPPSQRRKLAEESV